MAGWTVQQTVGGMVKKMVNLMDGAMVVSKESQMEFQMGLRWVSDLVARICEPAKRLRTGEVYLGGPFQNVVNGKNLVNIALSVCDGGILVRCGRVLATHEGKEPLAVSCQQLKRYLPLTVCTCRKLRDPSRENI